MTAEEEAAVEAMIAREPNNVAALIRKADLRLEAGDDQAAGSFYRAALLAASKGPVNVSNAELQRAHAATQGLHVRFEDYLESALARAGFGPGRRPPRFQKAIDILLGRVHAHSELQAPRTFFFPDLPQRRYYERSEFPWAAGLEAQTPVILGELQRLIAEGGGFKPYLYSDPSAPPKHGLVDNPDWSAFELWECGTPIAENAARCPQTLAALEPVDLLRLRKRAPQIMFSKLAAGASIEPHTGLLNCRLVCHLPLIVPPGCVFRVGGEDRAWHVGELLTFDDSIIHEALNTGPRDRVVLIFEIWRPELDESERAALTALFDAVDSY